MYAECRENCGITELIGFDHAPKLSYKDLADAADDSFEYDRKLLHFNIVRFSGNRRQGKNLSRFAGWLRRQREKVEETKWVFNRNTKNYIKAYTWCPTKRFRSKLEAELRKMYPPEPSYRSIYGASL
jgi:hypothetical protein